MLAGLLLAIHVATVPCAAQIALPAPEPTMRLIRAIVDNDAAAARRALGDGADPNLRDVRGLTPLDVALMFRRRDIADMISTAQQAVIASSAGSAATADLAEPVAPPSTIESYLSAIEPPPGPPLADPSAAIAELPPSPADLSPPPEIQPPPLAAPSAEAPPPPVAAHEPPVSTVPPRPTPSAPLPSEAAIPDTVDDALAAVPGSWPPSGVAPSAPSAPPAVGLPPVDDAEPYHSVPPRAGVAFTPAEPPAPAAAAAPVPPTETPGFLDRWSSWLFGDDSADPLAASRSSGSFAEPTPADAESLGSAPAAAPDRSAEPDLFDQIGDYLFGDEVAPSTTPPPVPSVAALPPSRPAPATERVLDGARILFGRDLTLGRAIADRDVCTDRQGMTFCLSDTAWPDPVGDLFTIGDVAPLAGTRTLARYESGRAVALHGFFPSRGFEGIRAHFESALGAPSYEKTRPVHHDGYPFRDSRVVGWRNRPAAGGPQQLLEIEEHAARRHLGITPDHGTLRLVRVGDVDGTRFVRRSDLVILGDRLLGQAGPNAPDGGS